MAGSRLSSSDLLGGAAWSPLNSTGTTATARHPRWTRTSIVAELHRIRKRASLRFNKSDFQRHGHSGLYQAATKCFGSWRAALAAAGISYADNARKRPNGWHADAENVRETLRALARATGKPTYALKESDFEQNGASGLLQHYGTVRKVLRRAGVEIPVGGRQKNSAGHWDVAANRIQAVRAILQRSGKRFQALQKRDFQAAGVPGLLRNGRTIYTLCREAGFQGEPWELGRVPNSYFARLDNRARAVRWLERKTGKALGDFGKEDFLRHGLATLLTRSRPYGIGGLLRSLNKNGELTPVKKSWGTRAAIRRALDEVCRRTGKKKHGEIVHEDLRQNGLSGLYQKFGSMARLFKAAGVRYTGKENPYRASGFRWRSAHGHAFKSKAERDFDDLLASLLKVGASEHSHNVRYLPDRDYSADFVSRKHPVLFELAGWYFLGRSKNSMKQREYRRHLTTKMRLARRLGKSVVAVMPRTPSEWVVRANRPLAQVFHELGLLGKNREEDHNGKARKR